MIDPTDLDLFSYADNAEDAWRETRQARFESRPAPAWISVDIRCARMKEKKITLSSIGNLNDYGIGVCGRRRYRSNVSPAKGDDPFISTPERTAQIREVAARIARFIGEARTTLDIAIYDFRLRDETAAIITDALRERAKNKVVIRIIYDADHRAGGDSRAHRFTCAFEADRKPPGTESFVRSLSDIAQIKGVTGYRVLMHSKYMIRDGNFAEAAVFTGSANYTNDSWGLQENNLLQLRSQLSGGLFLQGLHRPSRRREGLRRDLQ